MPHQMRYVSIPPSLMYELMHPHHYFDVGPLRDTLVPIFEPPQPFLAPPGDLCNPTTCIDRFWKIVYKLIK